MERGDVSVVVTVGQLAKEKCNNFVLFCEANLDLSQRESAKLKQLNALGEVALLAALKEELYPHRDAVRARDLEHLPTDFQELATTVMDEEDSTQDTIWRYLELFCDILAEGDKKNK